MGYQTHSFSHSSPSTSIVFSAALFPQGSPGSDSSEAECMDEMNGGSWQEEAWSVGGEDFFVEDLLDLSNNDDFAEEERREREEEESNLSGNRDDSVSFGSNCSPATVFVDAVAGGELPVPVDELADLEWLSNFVEDSFSSGTGSFHYSPEAGDGTPKKPWFWLETRVPMKARSKRSRTGRSWSCRYSFRDSSSSSSTSSSTTTSCLNSVLAIPVQKKRPGRRRNRDGKVPENSMPGRRCSHCLVQKTPQWRIGPLGSKTLCNACGVRYKSGRLLPEYRPAGSPTFLSDVHSNSHRKVIEMRRKKEMIMVATKNLLPQSGFPAVQCY